MTRYPQINTETENCWTEINLHSICSNLQAIKRLVRNDVLVMPVIKSEAYGHGLVEIAEICQKEGVIAFAVANVEEGIQLRKAGIKGLILVLYNTPKGSVRNALKNDISMSLFDQTIALALHKEAKAQKKIAKVHIPIDTGMGWYGLSPEDTLIFAKKIKTLDNLKIEGIYSHFSKAGSREFSQKQIKTFRTIIKLLEKEKISPTFHHLAKSSGVISYNNSHFDTVRPGLMLFGICPKDAKLNKSQLKPVMSFKTRVFQVRTLPKNTPISYDGTFVTQRKSKIAVLPVGYSNGLSRYLSNRGEVIIKGKKYPIVGNICMNITIVDVTNNPKISAGDIVTILGKNGNQEITANDIAKKANTTCYEILTSLGTRNKRVCIDS